MSATLESPRTHPTESIQAKPQHGCVSHITPPPPGVFSVARTLEEVFNSWRLVYNVYAQSGFISTNPYGLHTAPQAVNRRTAVFYSTNGRYVESTLSAILDGPDGLPLDTVYQAELDVLRRQGRRLNEHGLLAHYAHIAGSQAAEILDKDRTSFHRNQLVRVRNTLIHLMCRTFFFGLAMNCTDIVIGVHPKHVKFYKRAWGFGQAGPERTYPTVNHRPVILMRLDLGEVFKRSELPYALDFCLNNPVPLNSFHDRCRFEPSEVVKFAKPFHQYLRAKHAAWEQRTIAWALRKVG